MNDASKVVTRKLYDEDAYRTEFEAVVKHTEMRPDGRCDVVLDQTAFFPEEGGQYPDRGTLDGFVVEDVQIADEEIHHILGAVKAAEPPAQENDGSKEDLKAHFTAGRTVSGKIDWADRHSKMQMHSGEHIFSGLVYQKFGYDNVGFHLSPSEMTMDFEGKVPEEALAEIETKANEAVYENVRTKIIFPTLKEREHMQYRSKLDLQGKVRIVIFPGYDACACCAPHVRSTAEIGLIKVLSSQNWKGGTRVHLACGKRAFEYLRKEHDELNRTARYLSAANGEVYDLTVRAKNENQRLKLELKKAEGQILEAKAEAVPMDAANVILFSDEADPKAVRDVINAQVLRHPGYCAVFTKRDKGGWSFIVGSSQKDCRDISRLLKEKFGARGGGKPEMVQGSVEAEQRALEELLK